MSFFRNLRSSMTRGRSSSRDTTPVRNSRPPSVLSGMGKRRDSVDSNTDSIFQRSDTFILDEPTESGLNSNTSTLEKKSKKSKVLEKFSTFTKRKKTPTPDSSAYEHHPSDNATNTYYKWQADGCNSLDYDSHTDPFNFLYEQTSLKSLHNGSSPAVPEPTKTATTSAFDSSTYRKGKMPKELKKQLEHLKETQHLVEHEDPHQPDVEHVSEADKINEADRYKTVTLNSLRKSFRDKFMQHPKEAPYNPSWFVEVDPPPEKPPREFDTYAAKENRTDFLVFENDNYRPGSRSPIRELNSRRPVRSATRSPVKRNDTFKVDRNVNCHDRSPEIEPSIRIEFKNSITPNLPGRMVPVGVAKPMPSQITSKPYYSNQTQPCPMNTSYTIKTSTTRLNSHQSPLRNWSKSATHSPTRSSANVNPASVAKPARSTRYQTLVQIKDNTNGYNKMPQTSPFTSRPSRLSTRIQLGGSSNALPSVANRSASPAFAKRYNTPSKPQPLKQTYFGDTHYAGAAPLTSARLVQSGGASNARALGHKAMTTAAPAIGLKYQTSQLQTTGSSSLSTLPQQSRSTPSYSAAINGHNGGVASGCGGHIPLLTHQHQQQPSRIVVAAQRRSRSPIKIPWR